MITEDLKKNIIRAVLTVYNIEDTIKEHSERRRIERYRMESRGGNGIKKSKLPN